KEERMFAHLTVWETLLFSARLRAPPDTPEPLIWFRVLWVLKLLGLSHALHGIVGDAITRGLSGGERRRLWFACEAVAHHSILLADSPTLGLDAPTALSLFRHMHSFASDSGFSMLTSITQASPELFDLFHKVLLLIKGVSVYFGPR